MCVLGICAGAAVKNMQTLQLSVVACKTSCTDTLAAALCARVPPAPPAAQRNAWKDVMGSYIRSREFSDDVARLRAQETR